MVLFNLATTLTLGVIFNRTRTVTAIAFAIFLAEASFNTTALLRPYEAYSVFALQRHGIAILTGRFEPDAFTAVGLTIISISICLLTACWRMKHSEL